MNVFDLIRYNDYNKLKHYILNYKIGNHVLEYALSMNNRNYFIIKLIIKYMDIDISQKFINTLDNKDLIIYMLRKKIIRFDQINVVKFLNDYKFLAYILKKGSRLYPSVPYLLKAKDYKTVELLIKYKAVIDFRDHDNNTPLIKACMNKDVAMIKLLIKSGADTELKNYKNKKASDYFLF